MPLQKDGGQSQGPGDEGGPQTPINGIVRRQLRNGFYGERSAARQKRRLFYCGGAPVKKGGLQLMAPEGTVKWFNDEKGYGFISPDEGAKVTYEATQGKKGMQANNVSMA